LAGETALRRRKKSGNQIGAGLPSENRELLFTQYSRGFQPVWQAKFKGRHLQARPRFVTTVKHGTALEALTRRRPRMDI
jgi:hypothetical protein